MKPTPIKGYKTPSEEAIAAVNFNKDVEEQILMHMQLLPQEIDVDQRWINIARTHFEQGFMALNRAIFQPVTVKITDE